MRSSPARPGGWRWSTWRPRACRCSTAGCSATPTLIAAMFFIFIIGLVLFASMALLPNLLQDILGYGVVETGGLLAMRGVGVLVSMQLASQLMRRGVDTRGCWSAPASRSPGYSLLHDGGLEPRYRLLRHRPARPRPGLGVGLVFIPLNTIAFATLAPHFRTDASSLMNLVRNIGSSLGVAVLTALLASNIQTSHADLGAHVTADVIDSGRCRRARPVPEPRRGGVRDGRRHGQPAGGDDRLYRRFLRDDVADLDRPRRWCS